MIYALGAGAYACVRFAEAYGLWFARSWAEWLAALSGALYVPVELFELYKNASWLGVGMLLANLLIVVIMLRSVRLRIARPDSDA